MSDVDEFEWIERALKPLAAGAPEAFGLADDAAAIPTRPGFDLIISKDAIVEGVHFLVSDSPKDVARKLLRVNLSDLAAKGAEPYGYFLAVSWPPRFGWAERERFVDGLRDDQQRFGLSLLGGDTTATPGPLTASVTILGWTPAGRMVRRAGARAGDILLVSGTIGDGALGLKAATAALSGLATADAAWLLDRYRLPQPRFELLHALRSHAHAATDVSDGLIADAGHIATASGLGFEIDLDRLPLSPAASAWLAAQTDQAAARAALATGGDDYEIVCAAAPDAAEAFIAAAGEADLALTPVGRLVEGAGARVLAEGRVLDVGRGGFAHR
ncbi:MAG TPA: thiamine-phosphate kinase [Caulobacteraceae bacterium]|nr:thiamine-phosphate kinase [Caulobacteraceae bacterium]